MKRGRGWITAGILFFLAAGIYSLHNLYLDYSAGMVSQEIYGKLQEQIEEAASADEDGQDSTDLAQPLYEQYPNLEMPTVEIDGYRYIGTLEIEAIDLALPVMTDWSYDQLEMAACRYSGSVYSHDIVICGHNYRSMFSPIKWLETGTEAVFTDVEGNTFYYELSYTDVIAPENIEDMVTADSSWDLTLFTCTTGGGSRMALRFVLKDTD